MNLRNRTGEERRRLTLCDKRDNNYVWKNLPPNFTFVETDIFVEEQKTSMLREFPTKHARNNAVTFVTLKRFVIAVLLRKLTIAIDYQNNSTSSPGHLGYPFNNLAILQHDWRHQFTSRKILPNLVDSSWLWWIMLGILANQNRNITWMNNNVN